MRDKISGAKPGMRIIAVEPQASPSLTKGLMPMTSAMLPE
jgi:predicted alternative tryptophan synthase beta-subunit